MTDADDRNPRDRAQEALDAAVSQLQEAADADNAAETGRIEQEAVSTLIDVVAEALIDGMNQPVGFYAGVVADESTYFMKSDVKGQITDRVEELQAAEGDQPLNEFVDERLERVTVTHSTDHNQYALYSWDFGTFRVETRSGGDGRGHFRWDHFRDLILESGGVSVARPIKDRRSGEDWRSFMVEMIEERGQTRRTRGPRTRAIDRLQNRVRNNTGYGTPEATLDLGGVWVIRRAIDVPEWWAGFGDATETRDLPSNLVEEIRIPAREIVDAIEDLDVTRNGLLNELDARGLTLSEVQGASMTEWVDGKEERFWALSPDLAVPREYQADPNAKPRPPIEAILEAGDDDSEESEEAPEPTDGSGAFESVGEMT